jgi:retron-type reverse transcriptase
MQTKLHRWAAADHGRRFDDLFNLVCDPATLLVAFERVAGNKGARTPGVDGLTVVNVERELGLPGYLEDLQRVLKTGAFRPLPVRERKIPKPGGSGKVRKLGIPTVSDRVVQAALKLVLEPIFEADFLPVSYGFRHMRRAHDAIAEIHRYGTNGYRWVLDADIEACFDSIDHAALMDRVRARVKDKRVLRLVKAFLKAGVLTEGGGREETFTGTPRHLPTGRTTSCLIRWHSRDSTTGLPAPQTHRPHQTRERIATGPQQVREIFPPSPLHRPAGDTPVHDDGGNRHTRHHQHERCDQQNQRHVHLTSPRTNTKGPRHDVSGAYGSGQQKSPAEAGHLQPGTRMPDQDQSTAASPPTSKMPT